MLRIQNNEIRLPRINVVPLGLFRVLSRNGVMTLHAILFASSHTKHDAQQILQLDKSVRRKTCNLYNN